MDRSLEDMLQVSVMLRCVELRGKSAEEKRQSFLTNAAKVRNLAPRIVDGADGCAEGFNALAACIAALSFLPDGVRVFKQVWLTPDGGTMHVYRKEVLPFFLAYAEIQRLRGGSVADMDFNVRWMDNG